MMKIIFKWILISAVIFYLPQLLSDISVESYTSALVIAFILTILHYTIRPILFIVTLPINILTLGLFSLVLNAIMFSIAATLLPGLSVSGFWAAFLGALIVSVAGGLIDSILRDRKKS